MIGRIRYFSLPWSDGACVNHFIASIRSVPRRSAECSGLDWSLQSGAGQRKSRSKAARRASPLVAVDRYAYGLLGTRWNTSIMRFFASASSWSRHASARRAFIALTPADLAASIRSFALATSMVSPRPEADSGDEAINARLPSEVGRSHSPWSG